VKFSFKITRYDVFNVLKINVHTEPNVKIEYNPQLRIEPDRLSERINTIIINNIRVKSYSSIGDEIKINVIELNIFSDLDMKYLLGPLRSRRGDDYFNDTSLI